MLYCEVLQNELKKNVEYFLEQNVLHVSDLLDTYIHIFINIVILR